MANGLIRGLIAKDTGPENIWASDPDESKLQLLAQDCGINTGNNSDIASNANVIVLAVKPQVMRDVCKALAADLDRSQGATGIDSRRHYHGSLRKLVWRICSYRSLHA